jgi:hypothetical protein
MQFLFQENGLGNKLLRDDPNRYIYEAARMGVDIPLPEAIAAGVNDVSKRENWNQPAEPGFALPTETWREHIARRTRCLELQQRLASGEINSINDFITYNLDIRQFAQDVIENCYDPELIWAFYQAISEIKILDPTCGSGAFLFAALNILEPLYEACLERMQIFLDEDFVAINKNYAEIFDHFRQILQQADCHPNRRYFILKSITINNLYGVDIMQEATEICKLRLFLKLVAQLEPDVSKPNLDIEPLPDIDFNIKAGNTLVGFSNYQEVKKAVEGEGQKNLDLFNIMEHIDRRSEAINLTFQEFRALQTTNKINGKVIAAKKAELHDSLNELKYKLDCYLADEYEQGQSKKANQLKRWKESHQPFHWFVEFYGIINSGGFDVIIGNPPYVEYSSVKKDYQIKGYETEKCGNLYVLTIERCLNILKPNCYMGMIVQLPIICTDRMKLIQQQLLEKTKTIYLANFDDRPGKLFDGLEHIRANIFILSKAISPTKSYKIFSTHYNRWYSEQRSILFETQKYQNISDYLFPGAFPKVNQNHGKLIIDNLKKLKPLSKYLVKDSNYIVYFHNAPQYWIRAMNFAPYFWNKKDGEKISSHLKSITFKTELDALSIVAFLNSSLFYWWFIILSNCRDLTAREIHNFPVGLDKMSEFVKKRLCQLAKQLMKDLQANSVRKECNYKTTGQVIYDEYYPKKSKPIIDEIDKLLGKHYDFTDEELDFIINYDIKYRMGQSLK